MSQLRKVNDGVIIAEAIRLVQDGVSVTFPVNGKSMLPFIVGGRDSVILEKPKDLRRGDVVLAWVETERRDDKHYVVHRIMSLDGDAVTLMGDGNLALREYCKREEVFARVSLVVKPGGKKLSLDSFWNRAMARAWYFLLPLRRYLLWIYNKVK